MLYSVNLGNPQERQYGSLSNAQEIYDFWQSTPATVWVLER